MPRPAANRIGPPMHQANPPRPMQTPAMHHPNPPRPMQPPAMQSPARQPHAPHPSQSGQQMPPMHLLNPTGDPNVKFEPLPEGFSTSPAVPVAAGPVASPIQRLINLAQGENNSIIYYENLLRSRGVNDDSKELISELLNSKRQQLGNMVDLYRLAAKRDWAPQEMQIEEVRDFRAGISYALLQESRLLREITQIQAGLSDDLQKRTIDSLLHNKIADIAHLMAV